MPEGKGRPRAARAGRGRLRALPAPVNNPAPSLPSAHVFELRGRQRLNLIRDLAMGEHNHQTLAKRYDTTPQDIAVFAEYYDEEIIEVSAALSGTLSIETAGLWATRKQARLAELQQGIDDIDEAMASMRESNVAWSRAHRDMFRARLDLYRQIAEELGAYPQRQAPPVRTGTSVSYVIEAEDPEALQ